MPRRYREQILEVTKTVTVMEVANATPNKHPRACEVTVTNIASDSGHPVSLKISHMHKSQSKHRDDIHSQIPNTDIEENSWNAFRSAPNGTTRIEQEHTTQVEHFTTKVPNADTTFSPKGHNIIDLQFTLPVVVEKPHDYRKQWKSCTIGPVQTLYYTPFSEYDVLRNAASEGDVDAHRQTPPLQSSSVMENRYCESMTRNITGGGDPSTHIEDHHQGRSESADGRLVTISDSCDHHRLESTETEQVKYMESIKRNVPAQEGHKYIITSLSQSQEAVPTPTVRRIRAEVNASTTSQPWMSDELTTGTSFVPSSPEKQVPCAVKTNRNVLDEQNSCGEVELVEERRPPSPKEAKGIITSSQDSNGSRRPQVKMINDGSELRQSQSNPVVQEFERSKRASSPSSADGNTIHSNMVGSSPIVVINQHRKDSPGLSDSGKNRIKRPVTDIDWFAAFNMKEPTRSKSPRDQAVDVLKEAEIVGGHVHSSATLSQREAVKRQMNESKINIDDVFCQNSVEEANLKKCSCSACNLEKPSDDERNQVKRESLNHQNALQKQMFQNNSYQHRIALLL